MIYMKRDFQILKILKNIVQDSQGCCFVSKNHKAVVAP